MTLQTLRVLAVLMERPTIGRYGLEIARAAGLTPGTLYPILARLERAGWLESEWEAADPHQEGRPRRRYYQLTGVGLHQARHALQDAERTIRPARTRPARVPRPGVMPA